MNQMLFPAQVGAPQPSGQSSDIDTLDGPETGDGALFGVMMGAVQQSELAAEWRHELASLGNSLPPQQAKALNSWLQQLSSGQLSSADLKGLPAEVGALIEERLPQLASLLNKAMTAGGESFKQALSQLVKGVEGEAVDAGPVRSVSGDPARLWSLNPVAKMIQSGVNAEQGGLESELVEGLETIDTARPLRVLASASVVESRGADPLIRTVTTPIHDQSWGRNFAEQVLLVQQAGSSRARLILDPPNLGPVEVDMKMQGDQTSIVFHSPHQSVRDSIENSLPRLRDMMADQGVDLLDVNVSGEQPKDQQSAAQEQIFAEGRGSGGDSDERSGEDSSSTQTTLMVSDLGLVDYYA